MTAVTIQSPPGIPPKTAGNAAEWWHSLGDVPLERIIMHPAPGTATERDLLNLVERDKRLCELIDGTLVEKPVGWLESLIAMRLGQALSTFIEKGSLGFLSGEAGTLRMASGRVRLPDLAFVSVDDLPEGKIPRDAIPMLPPRLAVEVLSQTNTPLEMRKKLKEYFESGCRIAWIIDPASRTVAVFDHFSDEPSEVLTENDELDGANALPGFTYSIAMLFTKLL